MYIADNVYKMIHDDPCILLCLRQCLQDDPCILQIAREAFTMQHLEECEQWLHVTLHTCHNDTLLTHYPRVQDMTKVAAMSLLGRVYVYVSTHLSIIRLLVCKYTLVNNTSTCM